MARGEEQSADIQSTGMIKKEHITRWVTLLCAFKKEKTTNCKKNEGIGTSMHSNRPIILILLSQLRPSRSAVLALSSVQVLIRWNKMSREPECVLK